VAYDESATFVCSMPQPIPHLSAQDVARVLQDKLDAETRPLEDTLTEFLDRADRAVERAIPRMSSRATTVAQRRAYEASLEQIFEPKKVVDSLKQVPSRGAETLSPLRQRLRDLAD
jgi:hypothetical protein